jgi:[pyruvate, water dikinase]-phosphate phosphotransferase / [pyruvate, water dikinase] kinase
MKAQNTKQIVIISDATGSTARRLVDAILVQYKDAGVSYEIAHQYKEVRTHQQIQKIIKTIKANTLVIYTIITKELSDYLHELLVDKDILHLDVLAPMMRTMTKFLGAHPHYQPGLLKVIDEAYFHGIEAIDFARQHDDGCGARLREAELILIGPSRSCKTPLSMFLACNEGLWVANIPIIPDDSHKRDILQRLNGVDRKKIIAMLIAPDELAKIRADRRVVRNGQDRGYKNLHEYHDLVAIQQEIIFCRRMYEEAGWMIVNVTRRAIEDIAEEILRSTGQANT